jgi:hypothetical protein
MLSALISEQKQVVVDTAKYRQRARLTGVDISAFAMKVVQGKKHLFCYALGNGQRVPVLPRLLQTC